MRTLTASIVQALNATCAAALPAQVAPKDSADLVATTQALLESAGRQPQRLFALDDRIFVRHGMRGFWVLERDPAGRVTELVNWRDNNPVAWRRVQSP